MCEYRVRAGDGLRIFVSSGGFSTEEVVFQKKDDDAARDYCRKLAEENNIPLADFKLFRLEEVPLT